MTDNLQLIGAISEVDLPELGLRAIPARVDTGAQTSAIWASFVAEKDGVLSFTLFNKTSPFYSGKMVQTDDFVIKTIGSSNGIKEKRYAVKLLVNLQGKKVKATFSLANRASQKYPILIGRNLLRGKFIVNIKHPAAGQTG